MLINKSSGMRNVIIVRLLNISLLVFTIFLVFIVPFFPVAWHRELYSLSFAVVFISAAFAVEHNRNLNILFAISTMGLDLVSLLLNLNVLSNISLVVSLLFFFYVTARFIFQISSSKRVNAKVIAESITGYLMLGIGFAILIALSVKYDPLSISFPASPEMDAEGAHQFSRYIYYSLVSLSTLGYGDVLPTVPFTRSLMTFITVCGQFYMTIVVALIIG